jgi:putative PIN family toxin of toxin-antitoxin system
MSDDRPKVGCVFDCMIFLQGAARRESSAGASLALVEFGAIRLFVSHDILVEVREVLARPRVRQSFPALTDQIVKRFIAAIEERATVISEVPRIFRFERDPKDEPYINLAVAVRASYLVSRDKDILDLADASTADGERLRRFAPDLQILELGAFLTEIRGRLQAHPG